MSDTPELSRDEIEALLVFLANDTLEGEERAAVEAAVAADPQLAGELEALKAMRREMQAEEVSSPGEMGLSRLMREIDAEAGSPVVPQAGLPEAANLPTAPGSFWKIAAVVLFGLVVAQTAYIGYDGGTDFELAGGESPAASAEFTIRVAFAEDAAEAEIRALLLEQGLVIVDGPSAIGLYTLAAPDDAARAEAVTALMARDDIVESAE
ncbi:MULTISPECIES: hypothetical protein [Roseovarius]|jgi:anti-sigma factor RsiW|uniref:hypothetical protein n=1 Tax=Roseovarius TaxID=74030 RepID=UPI00273D20EB|nr:MULTISPECIES: hypothetical protein [unclassified Roseovarius]